MQKQSFQFIHIICYWMNFMKTIERVFKKKPFFAELGGQRMQGIGLISLESDR